MHMLHMQLACNPPFRVFTWEGAPFELDDILQDLCIMHGSTSDRGMTA